MRFSSPPVNPSGATGGLGLNDASMGNLGGPSGQGGYNTYGNMGSFGVNQPNIGGGPASYPQVPINNMMGMGMGGQGAGAGQWGMNDATTQMGMQFGRSAMMAGQEYVEKNVSSTDE